MVQVVGGHFHAHELVGGGTVTSITVELLHLYSESYLTVIPGPCTPRTNARKKNCPFLIILVTMDYSGLSHDTRIELTITDLNRENLASITTIAKRYTL
jgi:hypothetical protein